MTKTGSRTPIACFMDAFPLAAIGNIVGEPMGTLPNSLSNCDLAQKVPRRPNLRSFKMCHLYQ
jgi:hypothetical protein